MVRGFLTDDRSGGSRASSSRRPGAHCSQVSEGLATISIRRVWPSRRTTMIRKMKSGEYRLYSQKPNPQTGKRRNLGTFATREEAQRHERAVQYFKRTGHPGKG